VRNTGPETWRLAETKLGYHWYYFDGAEAVWSAGTAPLPRDVPAGETVIVPDVAVRVPDYNGPMYLVFDLEVGGSYVSTLPGSRGADLLVLSTLISGGRHLPLDLTPIVDTDGISTLANRADGDLDGNGGTLPAELLPPYVLRPPLGTVPQQTNLYPCGLWDRLVGMKSSPQGPVTDAVTFRFPDKREHSMNVVSCAGQRIQLSTGPVTALHLLGCATAPDAAGSFTIVFKDGTSAQLPLTMSLWTAPPHHGEHIAFASPRRHTPRGDDPVGGAYLNHYTLYLEGAKPLAAIVLPQNRSMKVFAITVEALEQRSSLTDPSRIRLPPNLVPK
jgi:hypothetical protein